jgi:hypothetical protein
LAPLLSNALMIGRRLLTYVGRLLPLVPPAAQSRLQCPIWLFEGLGIG